MFMGRHVFYVRGAALVADGVRILLLNCQRKEGRSKASLCASSSCLSICTVTEQLSSGFFYCVRSLPCFFHSISERVGKTNMESTPHELIPLAKGDSVFRITKKIYFLEI